MSYQIEYGSFRYDHKQKTLGKRQLIVGILSLITAVMILLQFPHEIDRLRQTLLPFFEPHVQQAFGNMVARIDEGEKFSDAASAFCREIIFEET